MREKKLHELLQKKRALFEEIFQLAESQKTAPLQRWFAILQEKMQLVCYIEKIDEELKSFFQSFHTLSQEIIEELQATDQLIRLYQMVHQNHLIQRKQALTVLTT